MVRHRLAPNPAYGDRQIGLFATTHIFAGRIVFSEKPLVSIRSASEPAAVRKAHSDFFDTINALPDADLGRLKNLCFRSNAFQPSPEILNFIAAARPAAGTTETFELLALKAFFAYSIPFAADEEAATHRLFAELCFLNHSCTPNATLIWNAKDQEMELRAVVGIREGEEIVVSYLQRPFLPKEDRHRDLGFECKCAVCTTADPEIEANHAELCESWRVLYHAYASLPDTALPTNVIKDSDRGLLRAIVSAAGHPRNILDLADRVDELASSLRTRHASLAMVFELATSVALAWLLTHPEERDSGALLAATAMMKGRDVGARAFCAGRTDELTVRTATQLWHLTKPFFQHQMVFSKVLEGVGLAVEVKRDGLKAKAKVNK